MGADANGSRGVAKLSPNCRAVTSAVHLESLPNITGLRARRILQSRLGNRCSSRREINLSDQASLAKLPSLSAASRQRGS